MKFYGEMLGLEQAWVFKDNIVGYKVTPGFLIVLCEDKEKVQSKNTPVLVFAVNDIDKIYNALKSRGVQFSGPPIDKAYGRITGFRDPDGYPIDLCG